MGVPKITVVTPSFNQAEFIDATLHSVHVQQYPNLEHIVIDGGSTDGSVEIIEKYADRLATWVSEPDQGQADGISKGFARATGDIYAWLNSDDLYEPYTLAEVADYFTNNPSSRVVYGDSLWVDRHGGPIRRKAEHGFNRFIWMYDHNFLPQPSTFWRADLYHEVGGVDSTFDLAIDTDLWIRFAQVSRIDHVRRTWSRMRFYPEQKNIALRARSDEEDRRIRNRYLPAQSDWQRKAKRLAARGMRIGWKLATGRYGR